MRFYYDGWEDVANAIIVAFAIAQKIEVGAVDFDTTPLFLLLLTASLTAMEKGKCAVSQSAFLAGDPPISWKYKMSFIQHVIRRRSNKYVQQITYSWRNSIILKVPSS